MSEGSSDATLEGVDFYRHQLGDAEVEALRETIGSLFLTTGPKTKAFEEALAARLGVKHAVGLSSCTSALFLALKGLGIGPGDEVITTPMTFIATANVILHCGARPVLIDVEPDTGNLDVANVAGAMTEKTRAILPVHLYGQMVDIVSLQKLADERQVHVIEDAAHAVEAARDRLCPGKASKGAAFSFYATKNLACGEGGAFATDDDELAARVRTLRSHGMSKEAYGRYHGAYTHWDMTELGYKANLPDILACVLLPQMPKIDERRDKRQKLWETYRDALSSAGLLGERVQIPAVREASVHSHHLFTAWVAPDRRDDVLGALQAEKIGVAVNYRAIHLLTYYRETFGYDRGAFPHAERIGDSTLSLPFFVDMTESQVARVVDALARALR